MKKLNFRVMKRPTDDCHNQSHSCGGGRHA